MGSAPSRSQSGYKPPEARGLGTKPAPKASLKESAEAFRIRIRIVPGSGVPPRLPRATRRTIRE